MIRIILNGKKATSPDIRSAVALLRNEGVPVEVRVTWEYGDGKRMVQEAGSDKVSRIVAAGGDGTLNEIITALAELPSHKRPKLGIIPLGTANDFATACDIPVSVLDALRLAVYGSPKAVDIVRANERYFVNVSSGGFGAEVSAETPVQLKNLLGGGAYALSAVIKALNFTHSQGRLIARNINLEGSAVMAAVCNGRQAGGGQILAPTAYIDDGLLDVMVVLTFPIKAAPQVLQELRDYESDGQYIKRFQTPWLEAVPDRKRSINLDGEPYEVHSVRFDVLPKEIEMILPANCPCLLKE